MTQWSLPQADNVVNIPNSDAGPYSRDQWAKRLRAAHTGDDNTAASRTKIRGVIPTYDNLLVPSEPVAGTVRVGSGGSMVYGSYLFNDADVDFNAAGDAPVANPRIDLVCAVENNTNTVVADGTAANGWIFPTDLTDYDGLGSIPAYSARLVIIKGAENAVPVAPTLDQSNLLYMVEKARYQISTVPVISNFIDSREFADIETIVGVTEANDDTIADALILGTQVTNGAGDAGLGVGVRFKLEDDAGTLEDAARDVVRWEDATSGSEDARREVYLTAGGADNLSAVTVAPAAASIDGNPRGPGAVDLQQERANATEVASGAGAFIAGGRNGTASGAQSHAEGSGVIASNFTSHAEGNATTASGQAAHAEGDSTTASGVASHAEGSTTAASNHTSHAEGNSTTASGVASHAEGDSTLASGAQSHAEGDGTTASAAQSHAEGLDTMSSGVASHAEGFDTTANVDYAHAEGSVTTASGQAAHAEGNSTTASGVASHAEGDSTLASGIAGHAEGGSTTADGDYSHAEGGSTTASGDYSHAGGLGSAAAGDYGRASGRRAKTGANAGVFIWADSQDADFTADRADQFKVRARGGVHLVQNNAAGAVPVLELEQDDQDEPFIDFDGTSAADQTKSISTVNGDGVVEGPKNFSAGAGWAFEGMVRISINGTDRWIPFYSPDLA